MGLIARDCRAPLPQQTENEPKKNNGKSNHKRDLKDVECFNCRQKGHYSSNCPDRSMFCMERRVGPQGVMDIRTRKKTRGSVLGVIKAGAVEGKQVPDILIDTGCSRTMVHEGYVPKDKLLQGVAIAIRCAHGDTVLYPLAQEELEVAGRKVTVEAAVSKTLPTAVLLGTDVAELAEILGEDLKGRPGLRRDLDDRDEVFVMTRAAARKEKREEEERRQKQLECEVNSKPLEGDSATTDGPNSSATTDGPDNSATTEGPEDSATTDGSNSSATTDGPNSSATTDGPDSSATTDGPDSSATATTDGFDSSATINEPDSSATTSDIADAEESWDLINVFNDDMFLVSRDKQQRTRREKRVARRNYREVTSSLDVTPEEFQKLQQQDPSLGMIRLAAEEELTGSGVKFFMRDGLIYRRWIPQERDEETEQGSR